MASTEGKIVVCPQCGKKYKLKQGFEAASFTCNGCSATVWVKNPRSPSGPTSKRANRSRTGGRSRRTGRGAGHAGVAKPKARGRSQRREPEAEEEQQGRRRYAKPKDNSATIIMAIVGVIAVGGIIFFVVSKGGDKEQTTAQAPTAESGGGETGETPVDAPAGDSSGSGSQPAEKASGGDAGTQKTAPVKEPETVEIKQQATDRKTTKKMGGSRKGRPKGTSRWAPPADLPHLESTPPEMRKKIDELIKTMMDHDMGRDSILAKEALAAIGKPAFPRVLGAMAAIRDTITDTNSDEEMLIESSLKLADECLRLMDGHLTAKNKAVLRPGNERKYIGYILILHYRRWVETLSKMPEMPGPFDPSQEDGEGKEYK